VIFGFSTERLASVSCLKTATISSVLKCVFAKQYLRNAKFFREKSLTE